MLKNPQNLKGLTVNLVLGLFKQCSRVQIFLGVFVERNSMDSSYMLWNKFQDYQVRFILTDHCLVKRFDSLTRVLPRSFTHGRGGGQVQGEKC